MSKNISESFTFSLESPSDNLAVTTADGSLMVYDTRLGTVQNRFVPTSHLSAACTCACWRPVVKNSIEKSPGKKSRKRKSSITVNGNDSLHEESLNSRELAVGTASGSLIIYSIKTADVREEKVHNAKVNGVVWDGQGETLFSCSDDGFLAKYLVKRNTHSKFNIEGKKHKLFALQLHPNESSLVVGTTAKIFWVDVDTHTVLKSFGGHKGDVTVLEIFNISPVPLVFSAATNERDQLVSVWKLDMEEDKSSADTMLNVNDNTKSICFAKQSSDEEEDGTILVGVVTKGGFFMAFEVDPMSKKKKKAQKPKVSVKVATDKDAHGKIEKIPILASRLTEDGKQVQVVYGNLAKPAFETLNYHKLEKETCLVRKVEIASNDTGLGIKVLVPDQAGGATPVLTPGSAMTPASTKRRHSSSGKMEQLPMLDRLRLLSKETDHVTTPPRTDSLLQLLLQGLHNQDRKILDSVLDRADDELIDQTVRKLPVQGVIPLIEELQQYIRGRGMVNFSHSKWLRSVLQHHTAFLMSNPHCEELLSPVQAMLEARTKHYSDLVQLKGKLDIMTRQINAKPVETVEVTNQQALLVHQDDSSDELSDVLDELLLPPSDVEDNWDLNDNEDEEEDSEDEEEEEDHDENEGEDEEEAMDLVNGVEDMEESD